MTWRRSSGDSSETSPVEPMISTAAVPWSSWNFNRLRNALKSTLPSRLNGVTMATKDPWILFLLMTYSNRLDCLVSQVSRGRC